MKTAITIFAGAMLIAPAAFASMSEVKEDYVSSAFADADDDWYRITQNRYGECGRIGSSDNSRLEVLVERYRELGSALDSDSDSAITAAGKKLYDTIEANSRFEGCWDKVSRREGIPSSFKRNLKDL